MSSLLLGIRTQAAASERRSVLGGPFAWSVGRADFGATAFVPAPSDAAAISGSLDVSLQKVAVAACVGLASTIAEMLPLDVFTGQGEQRRPRPMPAWLADLAGDGHGLSDWIRQAVHSTMLRGNLFGIVLDRDPRTGQPRQLVLGNPDATSCYRDSSDGQLHWTIQGQTYIGDEVWHRRVFPVPGQAFGASPITRHAMTIGLALSSENFGARWFADGAHPSAILSNTSPLDEAQATTAKRRFMSALRGRREPAVLGAGWSYQQVQIAPGESQFLETQKYTAAECCRIFGPAFAEVLGYETGGSMTYSNREQRTLDMLTYAADPWLVRVERWLSSLLPQPQYVRFNRGALLRTDLLSRFKAYNIGIVSKFLTPDEARDNEDWQPLTDAQRAELAAMSAGPVQFDQTGAKE